MENEMKVIHRAIFDQELAVEEGANLDELINAASGPFIASAVPADLTEEQLNEIVSAELRLAS